MSSPLAIQCLFCNHINPAGASFCNDCGSQLQLQQCDLCGSINKRSARSCYKCGSAFIISPAHAADLRAIDDGRPSAAAVSCLGDAHEATTLPESVALALAARRRQSSDGGASPVTPGGECARSAPVPANGACFDEGHDQQPTATAFSSEVAAATGFQYLRVIALVVLVMSVIVMSLYSYRKTPSAGHPGPEVRASAPEVPGDPLRSRVIASLFAPTVDAASARSKAIDGPLSRVPASLAPASPPLVARPCQEAVAALGLCAASAATGAAAHD